MGWMRYQIVDAPNWPYPTLFMIEAKGDSEADAKLAALTRDHQWAEKQHMLQVLLEERFKLKAHWETREGDVFNLVVAKGGPKLGALGSVPLSEEEKKMYGDHPAPALRQQRCDEHGCTYIAHGCSMGQLTEDVDRGFWTVGDRHDGAHGELRFCVEGQRCKGPGPGLPTIWTPLRRWIGRFRRNWG